VVELLLEKQFPGTVCSHAGSKHPEASGADVLKGKHLALGRVERNGWLPLIEEGQRLFQGRVVQTEDLDVVEEARMRQSGPPPQARSLSSGHFPRENMNGPIGSSCLTPCAAVNMSSLCELSTGFQVQPYAHLPAMWRTGAYWRSPSAMPRHQQRILVRQVNPLASRASSAAILASRNRSLTAVAPKQYSCRAASCRIPPASWRDMVLLCAILVGWKFGEMQRRPERPPGRWDCS
jgi:hypothetical protein